MFQALDQMDALSANNFRDLRTNIEYQLKFKKEKFVVVTSANQGEGKSYCALHTALSFSEAKKKVLLIDFDLHRPRLSKDLSYGQLGITAIYEGDVAIEECLISIAESVDFLPSGHLPLNTSEIVTSEKVHREIYRCLDQYDLIVIDCPPVRLSPDAKLIISEFKNVLFVIGANKTRDFEVSEAFDKLKLINPSILGMILNKKKFSRKERTRYEYK